LLWLRSQAISLSGTAIRASFISTSRASSAGAGFLASSSSIWLANPSSSALWIMADVDDIAREADTRATGFGRADRSGSGVCDNARKVRQAMPAAVTSLWPEPSGALTHEDVEVLVADEQELAVARLLEGRWRRRPRLRLEPLSGPDYGHSGSWQDPGEAKVILPLDEPDGQETR
jgi:hypothetical protein